MGWSAARLCGLKLILLAVSFAAVGGSLGPDPGLATATWAGVKLQHLILGTFGAGASLLFLPQFTLRSLGATIICGLVCAAWGTPFVMWAYMAHFDKPAFPGPAENALAVLAGVVGVYVIPTIRGIARAIAGRIQANPMGFIAWVKGGGAGQPPAGDATDESGGGHV
jgi:hypothetical protein